MVSNFPSTSIGPFPPFHPQNLSPPLEKGAFPISLSHFFLNSAFRPLLALPQSLSPPGELPPFPPTPSQVDFCPLWPASRRLSDFLEPLGKSRFFSRLNTLSESVEHTSH